MSTEEISKAVCHLGCCSTPWGLCQLAGHTQPTSQALGCGVGTWPQDFKCPLSPLPHESVVVTLRTAALKSGGVAQLASFTIISLETSDYRDHIGGSVPATPRPPHRCRAPWMPILLLQRALKGLFPLPSEGQFGTLALGSHRLLPPATPPSVPGNVCTYRVPRGRAWHLDLTSGEVPQGPQARAKPSASSSPRFLVSKMGRWL